MRVRHIRTPWGRLKLTFLAVYNVDSTWWEVKVRLDRVYGLSLRARWEDFWR